MTSAKICNSRTEKLHYLLNSLVTGVIRFQIMLFKIFELFFYDLRRFLTNALMYKQLKLWALYLESRSVSLSSSYLILFAIQNITGEYLLKNLLSNPSLI